MTQRNLPLRRAVATVLAVSCAMAATAASAQETPAESAAVLGEIIVTAQKREQSLQDVPVVVTAVSEQLLKDAGVKDIKDLTVLTPGLLVTSSSSEASTTARIRGIGTVGDNPGLESSVGIVIDGVYRPRNGVSFGDLGEMERVEVLKGPQGTLFGKNTTGGVINVVTKKPSFDPSAVIEVSGGNYGAFDVSASLNGPIAGDVVAGRLFAAIRNREGLLDVRTAGGDRPDDDNNRDFYTVRGQLLFQLSDTADLRLVADATERDEYCCTAVQINYGSLGVRDLVNAVAPDTGAALVPNPYDRVAWSNRASTNLTKDRGLSAELNWDIGDITLTSVTAGRDWESIRGQDSDFTTADLLYRRDDGSVVTRFRQLTEEVRLAGEFGRLNWLAGVFYAKEKLNATDSLVPGTALLTYSALTASGGTSVTLPGVTTPMTGANYDVYEQRSDSYAVFTNNSFEIVDGLELTIGARYTKEKKELDSYYWNANSTARTTCQQIRAGVNSGAIGLAQWGPAVGYGCVSAWDPNFDALNTFEELDESKVTGTAKLAWRINDAIMTYGSYARGYKASGYNLDRERDPTAANYPLLAFVPAPIQTNVNNLYRALVATTPSLDKSFLPETVDSYEVGFKFSLLDDALYINLAGFSQTYENFQYNTFTGIQFEVRTLNEVKSTGIDADLLYRTSYGVGIQAGVTYSHTDITEPGPGATGILSDLREYNRMPFAPVWSGSLAVTYRETFGDYAFGANVSGKYNSDYNTGSNLDPRKLQEAYTTLNARLSFGSADENWAIELWGQNLTNEEYAQVMFDATFQGSSATRNAVTEALQLPTSTIDAFLGAQRLYGASIILKF